MTVRHFPLHLFRESGEIIEGDWSLTDEVLTCRVANIEMKFEGDGDLEMKFSRRLPLVSDDILGEELNLKGCMTCKYFKMSGLARDMGRGQRGRCLVNSTVVELCDLCDEYAQSER